MTRPAPTWLRYAVVAIACTLTGVGIGIVVAPTPEPWRCSIEQGTHMPPCPPNTDREVWATWPGGLTTKARWHQGRWEFQQPVLGQSYTNRQPQNWSEL